MSRQGFDLDRSTLGNWVGPAAYELRPVFHALIAERLRSTNPFMDETRALVLDLGSRNPKTGYVWTLAWDYLHWNDGALLGVACTSAADCGRHHAERMRAYPAFHKLMAMPDTAG